MAPEIEKITLYWPKGLRFWMRSAVYAEGYLLEGERHGDWIFWYRNGIKQLEGQYVKGKKNGLWRKWVENGVKITEGEFLYGKMHGKWTDWYENGQKALDSHWIIGKKDGHWNYWEMVGSLKKSETYNYLTEKEQLYSIHTDLEAKQIVRNIQREALQKNWERTVGRTIANLVKPWHIACWVLVFISVIGLMQEKHQWRGIGLAVILASVITSLVVWGLDGRGPKIGKQ
ncbi:MAG: hypothetical protein JRF24_00500 [Deltaproteobacteria bacterium]|nr:hypothetical protein [Deltaproteobacteria bacterium]